MLLIILSSCRGEEQIVSSTANQVTSPSTDASLIKGLFLLCEGNMGSNKATIDYFDYHSGVYTKNIYPERNPSVVGELGDVGNDIQIYQDMLFAVINCSNLVEIMDLTTAEHIASVSIPNCRYIAFDGSYAYVTSYAGEVQLGSSNARLGYVAKVDLSTFKVVAECSVGYQPEQIAVAQGCLYVANSGGYMAPDYDTTLSVVDLDTFTEIQQIEVGVNLSGLKLDDCGCLWVSSQGNYSDIPSKTYVVDTQSNKVVLELDLPNSRMAYADGRLYVCSSDWSSSASSASASFVVIDTTSQSIVDDNFVKDGTVDNLVVPYGLAVNPETLELFITDASNYVTPGKVYCYSPDGTLKWSATTGDIPSAIAFSEVALCEL